MSIPSLHPRIEELHDLLDGELTPDRETEVSAHLDGCANCAELFDGLTRTVAALGALPVDGHPSEDGWGAVRSRLETDRTPVVLLRPMGSASPDPGGRIEPRSTRFRFGAAGLWAAGITLALVSGGTGWWAARLAGPDSSTSAQVAGGSVALGAPASMLPVSDPLNQGEELLSSSMQRLEAILRERGELLNPETRATVLESLERIDDAIREAEAALEQDPSNPTLHRLLASYGRARLRLLERVVGRLAGA